MTKITKKSILYCPTHFILSDTMGSEFNEAWSLLENIYDTHKYDITAISGKASFPKDVYTFESIEVWKDVPIKNSNEFTAFRGLKFNILYTLAAFKKQYFSNKQFDIMHHVRPFNLYNSFNFSILFNPKKLPTIIGPFAAPYVKSSTSFIGNILRFLNKKTLESASLVLVNDSETQSLIQSFAPKANTEVFPVGKNIADIPEVEKNYSKMSYEFLSCGQLIGRKNFIFLVESFALACTKTSKKLHLTIAGDGEQKKLLETYISQHNLQKHISLIGNIDYTQMSKLYKQADYFLLTPKQEAFAHVYIEASAYSLPTITTSTVASRAIIAPYGGLLSMQEDREGFAQHILTLVENPDLSSSLSKAARKYALETFDWKTVLRPRLLKIYSSMSSQKLNQKTVAYENS
jgi:glycosyltransferase involved in cell wall biosynthesis